MRYYWLKLREDFFRDLRVKALRRCENGDTLALSYLQLLLAALETGGVLPLMGVDEPAAEIALLLDITEETAATLLAALFRFDLLRRDKDEGLFLPAVEALTGGEGESANRIRRRRAKKEEAAADERHDVPAPSHCAHNVQNCDTEIEIESEIEIEIETEQEKEKNSSPPTSPSSSEKTVLFSLPTKQKQEYVVGDTMIDEYRSLWPELDIKAELSAMHSWLLANPDRRKSPADTPRFVYGWLSRSHERARAAPKIQHVTTESARRRSYDLEKAMEQMKTAVPKLKKKNPRSEDRGTAG